MLNHVSAAACVKQAAVGNLPVQDVYLSSSTNKLMVRLADSCNRLQSKHTQTEHDSYSSSHTESGS